MLVCQSAPIKLSAYILFWNLLWQLVIGIGLGWCLARTRFRGQQILDSIITLPLVFPPILIGYLLLISFGRQGWLSQLLPSFAQPSFVFDQKGLILAAFIAGLPLMVKPVQMAFTSVPLRLHEAAACLGYSPWQRFMYVDLPLIRSGVAVGLLLASGRALGEVGISLMLGGNISGRTETLSLAIYNHVIEGSYSCANELALLLTAIAALCFYFLRRLGNT